MNNEVISHGTLPSLKRQIRYGVTAIVGMFGVVGVLLFIAAIYFATGLTPKAIHRNYDSIEAATQMREAWTALRHPTENPRKSVEGWKLEFQEAIVFELSNITEMGERELAEDIEKTWLASANQTALPEGQFITMNQKLDDLVALNRKAMFHFAEDAEKLRSFTVKVALLFFAIIFLITLLRADKLAAELADPIRRITEKLRMAKSAPVAPLPDVRYRELQELIDVVNKLRERQAT